MCNLCDDNEAVRKAEQDATFRAASNLRKLATKLNMLAFGDIEPHSEESEEIGRLARAAIKYLAQNWL